MENTETNEIKNTKKIKIKDIEYTIIKPIWDDYVEIFQDEDFAKEKKDKKQKDSDFASEKSKIMFDQWVTPKVPESFFKSTDPEEIGFIMALSIEFNQPLAEMAEIKKKLGAQ